MINLIGLYGPSRAGKDETAAVLVSDFGFEQRAQAAAIRKILLDLDPIISDDKGTFYTMQHLFQACNENWDEVKARSRESVDYMIRLGQSCRDVIGLSVWVDIAIPEFGSTKKICISDVRQPNEYEAIKARGGQVWKITRPGVEFRGMDGLLEDREFDAVLDNRGTLLDLRGMVQATIATSMRNVEVRGTGYGSNHDYWSQVE